MTTLGANNWISYGWGQTQATEYSKGSRLYVDFRNTTDAAKMPALNAALQTVDNIVANYPGPYTLMCSGGVDSQAMLWAWHCSGHPYTVLSVKYISNNIWFNEYDLDGLNMFSKLYKIPIRYEAFDILTFLENNLSEVTIAYDCDSPQFSTHIKITEFISRGTIVFSGNHLPHSFNHTLLSIHRYAMSLDRRSSGIQVVPFFLVHTPSLAYGFVPPQANLRGYHRKVEAYRYNGFPVLAQANKFNGFEKIKEYYDQFNDRVTTTMRLRFANRPSNRVFDHLFRHPYEDFGNNKGALAPQNMYSF